MRALGWVLVGAAVTLLVGVGAYLLAVLPGQRQPLAAPSPTAAQPTPAPTSQAAASPAVSPEPAARSVTFSELELGTCLTDAHRTEGEGAAIDRLEAIDCAAAHFEEVIHLGAFDDADYPGREALVDRLDDACVEAFPGYVGVPYASSALLLDYLLPTQTSWIAGDRGYACLVYGEEPLVGSVRGSAR